MEGEEVDFETKRSRSLSVVLDFSSEWGSKIHMVRTCAIEFQIMLCLRMALLLQLECVALDHSKHAIQLTSQNAALLHVEDRISLVEGKVTADSMPGLPQETFDLIVSNPPYVLRKDLMNVQPEIML